MNFGSNPFCVLFPALVGLFRPRWPFISSSRCTSPVQYHQASNIVDQVHQAELHTTPGQTEYPQEQSALLFGDRTKHMFHSCSHSGLPSVGTLGSLTQQFIAGSFPMSVAAVTRRRQKQLSILAGISTICPNVFRTALMQQIKEDLRIVYISRDDGIFTDQLLLVIDSDVILVAVVRLPVLLGPARLGVFLALDMRVLFEALRGLTGFDLRVLLPRVALVRRLNKTGVDNLALAGLESLEIELAVEFQKQCPHQSLPRPLLPKQPHGFGIRYLVFGVHTQEPAKAEAIAYLVFQLVVGQGIQVLEDQCLEHHHGIEGLTAGTAFAGLVALLVQGVPKTLPFDKFIEVDQRIPLIQLFVAVFEIEETRLHKTAVLWFVLDGKILPYVGEFLEVLFNYISD